MTTSTSAFDAADSSAPLPDGVLDRMLAHQRVLDALRHARRIAPAGALERR